MGNSIEGERRVKRGDELRMTPEGFALEGKAIARVNGMAVFVRDALPGDQVLARITKVSRQHADAELVALLSPSPLRQQPRCRHFGVCGGCVWQHVGYEGQLAFKRQYVVDTLERIGGFRGVSVNPTLESPEVFFYRNKMEFSFGSRWLPREEYEQQRAKAVGERGREEFALGLHIPRRFDKILDIQECFLQSETSAACVNAVREFFRRHPLGVFSTRTQTGYLRNLVLRESRRTADMMVNLVTSDDRPEVMQVFTEWLRGAFPSVTTVVNNITRRRSQVAVGDEDKIIHGPGYITERIGQRTYRVSANSFFQTNTLQAERLYDAVARMACLKAGDVVFDLYSGTGTIALHIADAVKEVVAMEAVSSAVEDAKRNASINGVKNCRFIQGDLKEKLTSDTAWLAGQSRPAVIIIDPPRNGIHEKVLLEVAALRPERIVYVSCNPATQARDLKLLCAQAPYVIAEVQPVDMFPHTSHVENVVSLVLPEHEA